ncbi:MAG: MGMT family protein [Chitinophagia bacterium]|nr:MGMT family protein [Chitinophagia bacterium]
MANDQSSDIYQAIFDIVKLVPPGRVSSYGAIAEAVGLKSGARFVGHVLRSAPPDVPAHRIVNSKGLLTGSHHFNPPGLMAELLQAEGVMVEDNRAIDFDRLLWRPLLEL